MLPILLPVLAPLKKFAASVVVSSVKDAVVNRVERRRRSKNKDGPGDEDESKNKPEGESKG